MPVAPFPHLYTVTLAGGELHAPPRASITTGPPPQFGGDDRSWSPEELLVGAALSCLQSTFFAYARRALLTIEAFTGSATGTLIKGPGGPVFSSIDLSVVLTCDLADAERAEQVLRTAERDCIISRALAVPVNLSVTSVSTPVRVAG
jgi:organic hydroperoxide reductase OsmC/OhrA